MSILYREKKGLGKIHLSLILKPLVSHGEFLISLLVAPPLLYVVKYPIPFSPWLRTGSSLITLCKLNIRGISQRIQEFGCHTAAAQQQRALNFKLDVRD